VHFIRELPRLTTETIDEMKRLNPRSRAEVQEEIEEERFLRGNGDGPPPPASTHAQPGAHK